METRPMTAVPYVPQAPVRAEAAPVREAVRTDLPVPQAVSAQVGADQTRWQKNHDPKDKDKGAAPDRQRSTVTTDRATGDLVYQVLDPGTRAVLVQTPHESILKLRAYIHSVDRQRKEHHTEERAQEARTQEIRAKEEAPLPAAP
jgi:hypothetical protein